MKEDYLWDKTGAKDPEIERMEKALAAFRYRETAAPEIPAPIVSAKTELPRRSFRLSFALAALTTAAIFVCFGVWFQVSNYRIETVKDLPKTFAPPVAVETPSENAVSKPNDSFVKKIAAPKKSVQSKIVKIERKISSVAIRKVLIARNQKPKKPAVKLTAEEKYAYDRLMLALSITGSKLKLVTDKVYGAENPKAALENAR